MRTLYRTVAVVLMAGAISAPAAFKPPTDEQVAAAAENPAQGAALVADATPEEAAAVLKAIYEKIVAMNLEPAAFTARIALVTGAVFKAMPSKVLALAAALGKVLGESPALAEKVARIVVAAAATASGVQGPAVTRAFVDALLLAFPAATADFIGSLRAAGLLPSSVLSDELIAQIAPVNVPGFPPIIKKYPVQELR